MVLDPAPCDPGASFERQFHGEPTRPFPRPGQSGDLRIVDVARIEVFPPDLVPALPQVPRHHAIPVLTERVHRSDPTAVQPVGVDAEIHLARPGHREIVVVLAPCAAEFGRVMVHPESQLQSLQLTPQECQRLALPDQFDVGLVAADRVHIAHDHLEAGVCGDLGGRHQAFDHALGTVIVERPTRIEAHRPQSFGPELVGELRVLLRTP